ncbi:MAG: hypothetical protein ABSA32_10415 [Candidatus Acidiferrales bacterium]|jgi:hypothetical protein
MAKVLVVGQIKDAAKWEAGFKTHGDLFRSYSCHKPIPYAASGNQAAALFEPENLDTFMRALDSKATADAMEFDGIDKATAKMFVLDKEMKL